MHKLRCNDETFQQTQVCFVTPFSCKRPVCSSAKFRHCSAELEYPLMPRQRHRVWLTK
jgi:hypothetical protein